ncbi:MAG TPA: hypothetical protein VLA74_12400 [Nitrososphaeraceae archaeon]|nr:hypothetical protein [Nitrososphaeraceae archaeon]
MGILDTSPKFGVLSGGASSYSTNSSSGIAVANPEDPTRVILYKTEHIAVLQKTQEIKFITTFDDITKEGYRLMAISEGRFYFQKILDK